MIDDSNVVVIVDNLHEIFIVGIRLSDNSWQLEELRSSAKFAGFPYHTINTHMQIEAVITTAIATSQSVQNNRVETTRRQYIDNGGRVEVKETYFYYLIYDSKAKIQPRWIWKS